MMQLDAAAQTRCVKEIRWQGQEQFVLHAASLP